MDESPEMIRQQMEETKLQLSEKLETLEQQVAETVQSTGATVEAIEETVMTVAGAVQETVGSVGHVLDISDHVRKHPWLTLGGSVAAGYWLARSFSKPPKPSLPRLNPQDLRQQTGISAEPQHQAAPTTAYKSGVDGSSHHLRNLALNVLFGAVQEIVWRAIPPTVEYIAQKVGASQDTDPREDHATETEEQHLRIRPADTFRSGISY